MDEIRWKDKQGDECEIRDATLSHVAGRIIIVIHRGESVGRKERCVYVTHDAEEKLCDALNERRAERWIRVLEDFSEQLQKHNKELRELLEDFTELTTTLTKRKDK